MCGVRGLEGGRHAAAAQDVTDADLFGLRRGRCEAADCGGCAGFARPTCGGAAPPLWRPQQLSPALLQCARCGCPARLHGRVAAAAAPLWAPPDCPASGSTPPRASDAAPAPRWRPGDLVRCPGNRLGLVRSGAARLELQLLAEGASEGPWEASAPAEDLEGEAEGWPPLGAVVPGFTEEAAFERLAFQPGGAAPLAEALRRRRCKLCALGGSISLQRTGYRAGLIKALERRGVEVEDVPAAVGTAGCKALSLVVGDWVASKRPDVVFVEAAVNDGDELLEATPRPDVAGVLRAAEGIVRTVRRRSPGTVVIFLEMFLRDDPEAARVLKTGSEAWRDTPTGEAIGWYHEVGPRLHRHVCRRYGLAQFNLVPAMRSVPAEERSRWFRDDCHTTDYGGEQLGNLLARLLLWAVRQPALGTAAPQSSRRAGPPPLPKALDCRSWSGGRTMKISPGWLTPPYRVRSEKDMLKLGEQAEWWLLGPGGSATIPFKGRACGILTLLGPDAPTLRVRVDGGDVRRLPLLDRWCYYWRDSVVLLCEGLADATHTLEVEVEAEAPDQGILKRPPTSPLWAEFVDEARRGVGAAHQLWLLYACAVAGDGS